MIPETVEVIEIGAFKDCKELTEIPSDLFDGCNNMECVSYKGEGKLNETNIQPGSIKMNET